MLTLVLVRGFRAAPAGGGAVPVLTAGLWDMWLDCNTQRDIAESLGVTHPTVGDWLEGKRNSAEFFQAPESRQHFDIWQGRPGGRGWEPFDVERFRSSLVPPRRAGNGLGAVQILAKI